MQAKELAKLIKAGQAPCVIDVRSAPEFHSAHIPGALHLPFWAVPLKGKMLPADKGVRLVVVCEHGPRAELAKGLLAWSGRKHVVLLVGHMSGWRRAELPLEK